MKIKTCSSGHVVTTKNALLVYKIECHWTGGIHFTCPKCQSSGVLLDPNRKTKYKLYEYKKTKIRGIQ